MSRPCSSHVYHVTPTLRAAPPPPAGGPASGAGRHPEGRPARARSAPGGFGGTPELLAVAASRRPGCPARRRRRSGLRRPGRRQPSAAGSSVPASSVAEQAIGLTLPACGHSLPVTRCHLYLDNLASGNRLQVGGQWCHAIHHQPRRSPRGEVAVPETTIDDGRAPALSNVGLFTLLIGAFLPVTDFFIVNVALPDDRPGPEGVAGHAAARRRRLRDRVRAAARRRRSARRRGGASPAVPDRDGRLHGDVPRLRCRADRRAPRCRARPPGRGGRDDAPAGSLDHPGDDGRAPPGPGPRPLRSDRWPRDRRWAAPRADCSSPPTSVAPAGGRSFSSTCPVGLIGLALAVRVVPDTRSPDPAPVDRQGTALLAVTLLSLLVPLTEGRSLGWPAWTIAVLWPLPVRRSRPFVRRGGSARTGWRRPARAALGRPDPERPFRARGRPCRSSPASAASCSSMP